MRTPYLKDIRLERGKMQTIHKYQIQLGLAKNFQEELNEWTLSIPAGAEIVSIQSQFGQPVLYCIVSLNRPEEVRTFRVFATGEKITELPDGYVWKYRGIINQHNGGFTWHILEKLHTG